MLGDGLQVEVHAVAPRKPPVQLLAIALDHKFTVGGMHEDADVSSEVDGGRHWLG